MKFLEKRKSIDKAVAIEFKFETLKLAFLMICLFSYLQMFPFAVFAVIVYQFQIIFWFSFVSKIAKIMWR